MELDIKIDSLTNCLIDRQKGTECDTIYKLMSPISKDDAAKLISEGWNFDWSIPQENGYSVYGLYVRDEDELQGLIAIKHVKGQYYTHVDIVESAPTNIGSTGKYRGVGAHLFAIACKESWDVGNEGYVQFTAKSDLVEHYMKTLNAKTIGGQIMYIDSYGALGLIGRYFKEG